jgi:predicted nucleic acid-binding protein
MSAPALICDTGALLDFVRPFEPDHDAYRAAIEAARTRYVPALVLAEVDYFLRGDRASMEAILADLDRRAFVLAPLDDDLLRRAGAVDRRFASLGLGLVDASIVALAERLGVTRLATRDVRHFGAVQLHDGRPFDLVVRPRAARR